MIDMKRFLRMKCSNCGPWNRIGKLIAEPKELS